MLGRAPLESLPGFVEPMLASPTEVLPEGTSWVLELKWDDVAASLPGRLLEVDRA